MKLFSLFLTLASIFVLVSCGVNGPPVYKASPQKDEYRYDRDYLSTAQPEKKTKYKTLFWVKERNEQ